jgi:hypothetical protein
MFGKDKNQWNQKQMPRYSRKRIKEKEKKGFN